MEQKKTAWWKYVIAVIAFWILAIFGGTILVIWNALSPRMYRYEQGDLGYYILQILTGPFGVWLGHTAMRKITGDKANQFTVVNCVIAATLFIGLVVFELVLGMRFSFDMIGVLATGVAAILFAVNDNHEIKEQQTKALSQAAKKE